MRSFKRYLFGPRDRGAATTTRELLRLLYIKQMTHPPPTPFVHPQASHHFPTTYTIRKQNILPRIFFFILLFGRSVFSAKKTASKTLISIRGGHFQRNNDNDTAVFKNSTTTAITGIIMSAAATTTKDNGPIIACGTPASKKARCSSSNNNDDEHGMSEETPPVVIIASQHSMSESALLLSPTDTAATATATATEQQDVGNRTGKREDYLSWDDYFMAVAFLSAQRSKDPSTQVGACIVNKQKRVIGIGYNGFPKGCSDDVLPWARVPPEHGGGGELDTKYPYVTHAEVNAILNKCSADVAGATIYVALFPCKLVSLLVTSLFTILRSLCFALFTQHGCYPFAYILLHSKYVVTLFM